MGWPPPVWTMFKKTALSWNEGFPNWCFILVMIVCMFYILKIWKWQIPLVWLEPDFWTFQQKKSRINAFKSFKDYPFPGKVANLKILFRQRYLSAAPWWCKRSHWIFVKGADWNGIFSLKEQHQQLHLIGGGISREEQSCENKPDNQVSEKYEATIKKMQFWSYFGKINSQLILFHIYQITK